MLKGVAGNLSAYELQKIAGELEDSIKKAFWVDCALGMDKLEKSLFQVLESIKQLQTDQDKSETITKSQAVPDIINEVLPLFTEAFKLLKQNNVRAEEVFEQLTKCLKGAGVDQDINKMKEELSGFNFKEAQHLLYKIAGLLDVPIELEESI